MIIGGFFYEKNNKLTFKQKQEAVAELFKQFHRAKLKLYCLENTNFYPQLNIGMLHEKKVDTMLQLLNA